MTELEKKLTEMARDSRKSLSVLGSAPTEQKAQALMAAAQEIRRCKDVLLAENQKDVLCSKEKGLSSDMVDRLALNHDRVEAIARTLENIARLTDPVGKKCKQWDLPNGLHMERVRVPLGVIGMIYESRPNVTTDAGALCLMSGNCCILRGGSESLRSNQALLHALNLGIQASGLPKNVIQLINTSDREAVGWMLQASDLIDRLIPRGGKSLVSRVRAHARVPVLAHLSGNNHIYVDHSAELEKACAIIVNAKMRRPGICGAMETLLIDRKMPREQMQLVLARLRDAGCTLRGDSDIHALDPLIPLARLEDWDTEYLDAIASVAMVDGVQGATRHIRAHSSGHSDGIVASDPGTIAFFTEQVDSAIVFVNSSTQFADGGEFGFGAEIGIATGRLHARGPVALEELTTYKTIVHGSGQIRPD